MACRWHTFKHETLNPVWARSLMVWGAAEGLVEYFGVIWPINIGTEEVGVGRT